MSAMASLRRARGTVRLLTTTATVVATMAAFAVAAGGSASGAATTGDASPSYNLHTSSDCRSEERLAHRGIAHPDRRVDVDGDGRRDKVAVVTDSDARKACRVVVAVKVRGGAAYSAVLDPSAVPPRGVRARIEAMPDLGNDPGVEIVIDSRMKADGVLAQLFTLTRDGLERVPMPAFEDGNFYVEGGGVTYPRGASCNARGAMILSMAILERGRYEVTRHVYPVKGDRLRLTGPRMKVAHVPGDELVDRFPEFGSRHFTACSA
ncbi:MAG: hypothetical protein ACRDO2_07670 [Nocardioidaceae bacterium]